MKTTKTNGKIFIDAPFNREFIKDLKGSINGARWDGESWSVPEEAEETVNALLKEYFGYDPSEKMVTIVITAKENLTGNADSVYFNGYPVAYARGRDSGAKVSEGVCKISGTINSSGSVKNWKTIIHEGAQFKLNVPEAIAIENDDWHVEKKDSEKSAEQKQIENELYEMILQKYNVELFETAEIESIARQILSK